MYPCFFNCLMLIPVLKTKITLIKLIAHYRNIKWCFPSKLWSTYFQIYFQIILKCRGGVWVEVVLCSKRDWETANEIVNNLV